MRRIMNLRFAGIVSLFCTGLLLAASSAQAQRFQSIFGGNLHEDGLDILHTPSDGGAIAVGASGSYSIPTGTEDLYVVKMDYCGALQWSNTYEFGGREVGQGIEHTSDGNYIITGYIHYSSPASTNIFLMKIDNVGNPLWTKIFGGQSGEYGYEVMEVPNDSGFIISGHSSSFGEGGYLIRTDKQGNLKWSRTYQFEYPAALYSCTVAANGDILTTGSFLRDPVTPLSFDVLVMRVSDASGALIWANHYGADQQEQIGFRIRECADNSLIVAGFLRGQQGFVDKGFLMRLNSLGGFLTGRAYDDNLRALHDVAELPSGNLIVTGQTPIDVYLGEMDATTLGVVWDRNYGSSGPENGRALSLVPGGGNVFITGSTTSFSSSLDLYAIRASVPGGASGCNEWEPEVTEEMFEWPTNEVVPCVIPVRVQRSVDAAVQSNSDGYPLCQDCKGGEPARGGEQELANAPGRPGELNAR